MKNKTDIAKAVILLREIEAWLSVNQQPSREQLNSMRFSIKNFTENFPDCFDCGDTGTVPTYENPEGALCHCCK